MLPKTSIKSKDIENMNWFWIDERVSQCSLCNVYKFFTKNCPNYFYEIYVTLKTNRFHMCSS